MKYFIALILFIGAWFASPPTESSLIDEPHIAYVKDFLRLYPQRRKQALRVMPLVEAYSGQYGFEPIVPAVIISCESAWKPEAFNAGRGEFGLMQTHGICARGFNLGTVDGQLESGISCLAMARDCCDGSLKQAMTMYLSGRCKARTPRTKKVVARRLRIIEKWRSVKKI